MSSVSYYSTFVSQRQYQDPETKAAKSAVIDFISYTHAGGVGAFTFSPLIIDLYHK